jgi:LmbE family N-acetylglucosaminyl deacetylase
VIRFGAVLAMAVATALTFAGTAAASDGYTASGAVKLDVLGEWAHPDDDTSIIGPCGVWHQRYGVKCGIIMVTRGEGGGNAAGTEGGPALGLRRENEDRIAHFRSGTVDIFNLDRVDFFYNQSAPLTQYFWQHDETLRRVTRIIRMTQPEVYIGFTPTLNAGHGNHQQAGRFIWEGVLAAADPNMFPEQLRGPHALSTWQVKKVFSGGATQGTGGTTTSPACTTGFTPTGLDAVAGVWTGYDSPYLWPPGNIQGRPAGDNKIWEQIHNEGASAYPTQSRTMYKQAANANCRRFGMTESFVPFQPNGTTAAGQDDAILYGAVVRDPGGLPLGTQEYLRLSRFFNAPGEPFDVTVHLTGPRGRNLPAGSVKLDVPVGWSVAGSNTKPIGPSINGSDATARFTVTSVADAAVNQNYRISATVSSAGNTGYTDEVVRVVSPAEGRFQRWGKFQEYDEWLRDTAPQASRLGRSAAVDKMGAGETKDVPVVVHNWSTSPQSGTVSLGLPAEMSSPQASKPYGPLAPGAETTVTFSVSNSYTNATLPGAGGPDSQATNVTIPITTTYDTPSGSGSEDLTMSIVPTTSIPHAGSAPQVDGTEDAAYTGEALDIGRKWEPGFPSPSTRNCDPQGVDCGSAGAPGATDSTYARVVHSDDALYFFIHVRDDFQSYAVTPEECVAHWLADSVEILIDPRGDSSEYKPGPGGGARSVMDTATTFKLGVFPFTNDPQNRNGNGANGPCWERDADNHQGFATGPLASTVDGAPNAPGVQVASTAHWVGSNDTNGSDHGYDGGGYNLEVKIPIADLPAAVDPDHVGLNITPYDEDNTTESGTGKLRHIDQSTRLAWSTFGSVQSDPYRWGHARLEGYTPNGDSAEPDPPNVSHPNLDGAASPQTVYRSAHDGVPISGRVPAPDNDKVTSARATLTSSSVDVDFTASGPGTANVFLWSGEPGYIPVFETSCSVADDPPPDYGFTPCGAADGTPPPWAPDMSGRVVRPVGPPSRMMAATVNVRAGSNTVSVPVSEAERDKLAADDGRVLISFETPQDEVQALDVPLGRPGGGNPGGPGGGGGPKASKACSNVIRGTRKANRLIGTSRSDRITGLAGNDRIEGRGGADCLSGRSGRDKLRGGRGNDRMSGGTGNDRITGGKGADRILAGRGKDRIYAKDGRRDVIDCGRGRDRVVTRDKADRLRHCERR